MAYSQLGELINRPLYGIQARPNADDASLRQDIIEMAKEYASELRQHQPNGPYSLGGWSSGAMIAVEMAAQIEAAGESVKHVFILDGPVPVTGRDVGDESLLFWFLQDLALGLPIERLDGETFTGLKPEEQLRKAAALLEPQGGFGLEVESLMASFQVFRDVVMAGTRHAPTRISSDLTVVRVEEDIVDEFSTHPNRHENDWGWSGFTTGEVRCIRVAGTHHTFLKHPLVRNWCGVFDGPNPRPGGRA